MNDKSPLFQRTIALISAIPSGKVLTYGMIADLIGAPGCARHVSYILSSSSRKYKLPWHRVISSGGKIPKHGSHPRHVKALLKEGIEVDSYQVDLDEHLWKPPKKEVNQILKGLPKHKSKF